MSRHGTEKGNHAFHRTNTLRPSSRHPSFLSLGQELPDFSMVVTSAFPPSFNTHWLGLMFCTRCVSTLNVSWTIAFRNHPSSPIIIEHFPAFGSRPRLSTYALGDRSICYSTGVARPVVVARSLYAMRKLGLLMSFLNRGAMSPGYGASEDISQSLGWLLVFPISGAV